MKFSYRYLVKPLSVVLLLQGAGTAFAEIVIPEVPPDFVSETPDSPSLPGLENLEAENVVPGNVITNVDTVETQVQPVVSAVLEHLRHAFRSFALPKRGGGAAAGGDNMQSVWLSRNRTDFENTFARTLFEGSSDLSMLGYDLVIAGNHLVGLAVGAETTEIDTRFNNGGVETEGVTVTPYYGWMISDRWSFDLGFGYTDLDTDQFRVLPEGLGPVSGMTVTSATSAERTFATANLNGFWTIGDFSIGARLGYLSSENEEEAYTESDGTGVAASILEFEQTSIGGDIAWGVRSQPFLGVTLMKDSSSETLVFPSGEQPAADDDSLLLTAGWRYYGERFSAILEWNKRDGREEYREDGLWLTLRFNSQ